MACLNPGEAIEATQLVLPARMEEAAFALENILPALINSSQSPGSCRAVAAIVDRFESCAFEQTRIDSIPEPGGPIIALAGEAASTAILDSWLAKGTLLGEDGTYSVFVVFMDVMKRPFRGSWTVETITVVGTRQSVQSLLEELELEDCA